MKLIPLRISEENVSDDHLIDLLYIVNEENSHYCLITNIHGLLRSQSSHGNNPKYICRRCLHFCRREESYKNHVERCKKYNAQKTIFQKRNDEKGRVKVQFTRIDRQLKLPFYFVADFDIGHLFANEWYNKYDNFTKTYSLRCCI